MSFRTRADRAPATPSDALANLTISGHTAPAVTEHPTLTTVKKLRLLQTDPSKLSVDPAMLKVEAAIKKTLYDSREYARKDKSLHHFIDGTVRDPDNAYSVVLAWCRKHQNDASSKTPYHEDSFVRMELTGRIAKWDEDLLSLEVYYKPGKWAEIYYLLTDVAKMAGKLDIHPLERSAMMIAARIFNRLDDRWD